LAIILSFTGTERAEASNAQLLFNLDSWILAIDFTPIAELLDSTTTSSPFEK